MAQGQRPTPTALKLIRGNPGKRPLNPSEPQSPRERTPVPDHISAAGRGIWLEIVDLLDEMRVLQKADRFAVEAFVSAMVEFREAEEAINTDGRYYKCETMTGFIWRAHPAVAAKADADRRIRAWCCEFGMTPAARSRIETTPAKDKNPAEEYFQA